MLAECSPQGTDVITQLLQLDPRQRLSAKNAMRHPYFARSRRKLGTHSKAPAAFGPDVPGSIKEGDIKQLQTGYLATLLRLQMYLDEEKKSAKCSE